MMRGDNPASSIVLWVTLAMPLRATFTCFKHSCTDADWAKLEDRKSIESLRASCPESGKSDQSPKSTLFRKAKIASAMR